MPLNSALASAGILEPEEVAFLCRVYDRIALEGDSVIDRQARAAALVRLYESGTIEEEALLRALGYSETRWVEVASKMVAQKTPT